MITDKPMAKALINLTIDNLHSKGGIDFILIAKTARDGIAFCASDSSKAEALIEEGRKEVIGLDAEVRAAVAKENEGKSSAKTKSK